MNVLSSVQLATAVLPCRRNITTQTYKIGVHRLCMHGTTCIYLFQGGYIVYYSFLQFLAVPCIAGVLLADTPSTSYGLLFLAYITAETWLGPAASIVQVQCIHNNFITMVIVEFVC